MGELPHTATDLVDFFPAANRDGLNITWSHAVNSKAQLEQALKGDDLMLETDIIVRGYGTMNQTDIPIHAHPPATDSDITVREWIDHATQHPKKGLKLDFKCIEALHPTLDILNNSNIRVPVLLNADIAVGPGSTKTPVDAKIFIDLCNQHFPCAIMSLGFTTGWSVGTNNTYTWEMITDLLYKVHKLSQPVTFPLRAVYLSTSWKRFLCVLGLKASFSISVWSAASDDVDMSGLVALRKNGGKERVYFDLPETQMEQFEQVLRMKKDSVPQEEPHRNWNRDMWYLNESEAVPNNCVYLSTTGVLFLSRNSDHSTSQRVHSKQVFEVSKTEEHPLEISGQLQFIDISNVDRETQFCVYISCSNETVDDDSISDVLVMSISSSGKIKVQNISRQVTSTDSTLVESSTFQFTLCNIGIGLKPVLKVIGSSDQSKSEDLKLNNYGKVTVTESMAFNSNSSAKLRVSFCKVGLTKDILLEDFVVN